MTSNEKWFTDRLNDSTVTDSDKSSCLDMLEVLQCKSALPTIVSLIGDRSAALKLRERAASAVRLIGPQWIKSELLALLETDDAETRRLAKIALIVEPNLD